MLGLRFFLLVTLALAGIAPSYAQGAGFSPPDPFVLTNIFGEVRYCNAQGLTARSQAVNPALKTLVYIAAGQSNRSNTVPTLFTPVNTSAIDNFSICDGASYPISGPMLGTSVEDSIMSPGNLTAYVAD